jgi:uncharacterized protein YciI
MATNIVISELKRFVLEYDYVEDILEKRQPYRTQHLALLQSLVDDGKVQAAGPFSPPTGALFLFKDSTPEIVEQFVKEDPYISAGLVTKYTIREWAKSVGDPNF